MSMQESRATVYANICSQTHQPFCHFLVDISGVEVKMYHLSRFRGWPTTLRITLHASCTTVMLTRRPLQIFLLCNLHVTSPDQTVLQEQGTVAPQLPIGCKHQSHQIFHTYSMRGRSKPADWVLPLQLWNPSTILHQCLLRFVERP